MSERANERTSERASRRLWLLPALSHPFTDYGAVAKNVRLAVTVCQQNLPFRLAFSTCENKSLSRFSYRSGEKGCGSGGGTGPGGGTGEGGGEGERSAREKAKIREAGGYNGGWRRSGDGGRQKES